MSSSRSRSAHSRPTRPRATSSARRTWPRTSRATTGSRARAPIASAWTRRAERILGPDGDTYAHGYLALVRSEGAAAAGRRRCRARASRERAVDIGSRAADADLKASALTNLGRAEDRDRSDVRWLRDDGGGLDRGRQRRAVAVHDRGDRLPDDRRLPRHDRLPAGQRVDRGDREVLRPAVAVRVSRGLPDPPSRGRRRRRRLGAGGAGARAGDDRAGRLQRDAAAGRRLLRDRRHPPAARRFRGRRAGSARGARPRSVAPAGARPRPPRRGQHQGGGERHQRRRGRGDLGSLGARPAAARRRSRSPSPPATSRTARTAVDALERDRGGLPVAGVRGRPPGRPGSRPAGRRRRGRCGPGAARRRSRAGARSVRRTRSPEPGRSCRARCARVDDNDGADLELEAALASFTPARGAGRPRGSRARATGPRRPPQRARDGDARRSCSPTSSGRPASPRPSATRPGRRSCASTTTCSGSGSRPREGRSSTRPATGSSSPSMAPALPSIARSRIQQELRDLRAKVGFACPVRIGLHSAEANRRGADYSGMGVHVAARVAALAGGRDPRHDRDDRRGRRRARSPAIPTVLRGVTEPVPLALVDWA